MPKFSYQTRKVDTSTTDQLYGTGTITEESEITDVIQIELANTVFLGIAGLLFTCAVFLLIQDKFLPVINGLFLICSATAVAMLELYQPASVMLVIPFWNTCISRGGILTWLSVIAMNGFWLAGFISFALSIVVVLSHFVMGDTKLKPVFYDEVTMKPLFDHAPGLKPLFYGKVKKSKEELNSCFREGKNSCFNEENKEEEGEAH